MTTAAPLLISELKTALIKKQSFNFGDPLIIAMAVLAPRASVALMTSDNVFIFPLPFM